MSDIHSGTDSTEAPNLIHELVPGTPWDDPRTSRLVQPDSQTAAAYADAHLAVVHIVRSDTTIQHDVTIGGVHLAESRSTSYSSGSGYFLDRNGDIATAAHVALPKDPNASSELQVIDASGRSHPAHIVRVDPKDVAEIKLDDGATPTGMASLESESSPPYPQERLWALGYPKSSSDQYISPGNYQQSTINGTHQYQSFVKDHGENSCTAAAFADFTAKAPTQELAGRIENNNASLLDVDMHTEGGNSGEPAIDKQGKVVGLEVGGTAPGGVVDTHVSLLLPVNYLTNLINSNPSYTFEYAPDPSKPGYQMLTAIKDSSGNSIDYSIVPSLTNYLSERCAGVAAVTTAPPAY